MEGEEEPRKKRPYRRAEPSKIRKIEEEKARMRSDAVRRGNAKRVCKWCGNVHDNIMGPSFCEKNPNAAANRAKHSADRKREWEESRREQIWAGWHRNIDRINEAKSKFLKKKWKSKTPNAWNHVRRGAESNWYGRKMTTAELLRFYKAKDEMNTSPARLQESMERHNMPTIPSLKSIDPNFIKLQFQRQDEFDSGRAADIVFGHIF